MIAVFTTLYAHTHRKHADIYNHRQLNGARVHVLLLSDGNFFQTIAFQVEHREEIHYCVPNRKFNKKKEIDGGGVI